MATTINGVPESISRADYLRLIESIGLNPNRLTMLEFRMDGIYADVKAQHPVRGTDMVEGDEIATHRIYIRVVD